MKLVLQIVDPDGQVAAELALDDSRVEVASKPGHTYRLVPADAAADTDQPSPIAGPRAIRVDDDLIIDQIPSGYPVQLTEFFKACTPEQICTLEISLPGEKMASVTPLNEPLAAYAEGGFLMYSSQQQLTATIPPPPEAESTFDWRPIAGIGGGLAIAAAAGGGGGSTGSDASAPVSPQIVTGANSNSPTPVFSGTAEAGSTIVMTLRIGAQGEQQVSYTALADEQGNWSINTLTDRPTSGTFPTDGLPLDQPATYSIVATDRAGNPSTVTSGAVVIDNVAPDRPVISSAGDLSPSPSAALNGIAVINRAEAADGTVIDGTAEASSTVKIDLLGIGAYTFSGSTVADQTGAFSLLLSSTQLPGEDGTVTLSVTATDQAGNTSQASSANILVDRTISDATAAVSSVADDQAPAIGEITNGGVTNDTTPTVTGTVVGNLASDESLQILRDGQAIGSASVLGATWTFTDNLNSLPGGAQGAYAYSVQVADNAGNTGNGGTPGRESSAVAITVDTTAPGQTTTIAAVFDDDGAQALRILPGTITADTTPLVRVTLDDVLAAGEVLQLSRSQGGAISVIGTTTALTEDQTVFDFSDSVLAGSRVAYQAQIVDAAGIGGLPSAAYIITIADPSNSLP